jgi:hypothetical protein
MTFLNFWCSVNSQPNLTQCVMTLPGGQIGALGTDQNNPLASSLIICFNYHLGQRWQAL